LSESNQSPHAAKTGNGFKV